MKVETAGYVEFHKVRLNAHQKHNTLPQNHKTNQPMNTNGSRARSLRLQIELNSSPTTSNCVMN